MTATSKKEARPPALHRMYLTGFMASGKSTVGPLVAEQLGWSFLDLDEVIESRAGRSISTIFDEEGEAYFRRLETEALRSTSNLQHVVVATGGGALVQDRNLQWALEQGLVVYLQVSAADLAERLASGEVDRPLLRDDDGTPLAASELEGRIASLLEAREPHYRRAHATVLAEAAPVDVTEAILAATQAYELR